jgi:hypothetical protein
MLSIEHKFLFVHIPKTAGNSIQSVLRQHSCDNVVCLAPHQDGVERFEIRSPQFNTTKHSTLATYKREYDDALFATLFKFTCVRNPWDRAISYYWSPHRGQVSWGKDEFKGVVKTIKPVSHYLSLGGDKHQSTREAVSNVDYVMRWENLTADFAGVCEAIGIPSRTLPLRNQSARENYQQYYDKDTRELVYSQFRDEIEYFGYTF